MRQAINGGAFEVEVHREWGGDVNGQNMIFQLGKPRVGPPRFSPRVYGLISQRRAP